VSSKHSHPRVESHEDTKSEETVHVIIATGHYPEPTEYNSPFYTLFFTNHLRLKLCTVSFIQTFFSAGRFFSDLNSRLHIFSLTPIRRKRRVSTGAKRRDIGVTGKRKKKRL
jgi:hypothetical protein